MTGATLFALDGADKHGSIKDLQAELSQSLANRFPDKYAIGRGNHALVYLRESETAFTRDKRHRRYRAIACNAVRLKSGIAFEFCVSNLFEPANVDADASTPDFEGWKLAVSKIDWSEHLQRVRDFVHDLEVAGWMPIHVPTKTHAARRVLCRNDHGTVPYVPGIFSKLAKAPLTPATGLDLLVMDPSGRTSAEDLKLLRRAIELVFVGTKPVALQMRLSRKASRLENGQTGLLIIPSTWVPASGDSLTTIIESMEQSGSRFRICLDETLKIRYAVNNIAFALFHLAGGRSWTTELKKERQILALDAGHLPRERVSRWCGARYDEHANQTTIAHALVPLHEDLTQQTVHVLASGMQQSAWHVWRDGRWHRDDQKWFQQVLGNASFQEIVKNPSAVLFRGSLGSPQPPAFGDCAMIEQDHWLIQTLEPNQYSGYSKPLRLRGSGDVDLIDDMLALCKRPLDSLSHSSRLPAPVFWADRASKLSTSGWLRAVGHGWKLDRPKTTNSSQLRH